jgi:hypothetical protein
MLLLAGCVDQMLGGVSQSLYVRREKCALRTTHNATIAYLSSCGRTLAVTPWSAQIENLAAAHDLRGIHFYGCLAGRKLQFKVVKPNSPP